ncbi:hypothetical protein F0562_018283 [Nyssa sinensis]|uniref:Uncharacterized protein n=1 Tax=Nyssa sinensis TaxID=561372 RepID=A0A5J4Z938_9ASTE|nr:hypothetical protein F0562_018283 [Nyssa sinensis]
MLSIMRSVSGITPSKTHLFLDFQTSQMVDINNRDRGRFLLIEVMSWGDNWIAQIFWASGRSLSVFCNSQNSVSRDSRSHHTPLSKTLCPRSHSLIATLVSTRTLSIYTISLTLRAM